MKGRIGTTGFLLIAFCWTLYLLTCGADDWLRALLAEKDAAAWLPSPWEDVFETVVLRLEDASEGWRGMPRHTVFDDPRYGLLLDKLEAAGFLVILRLLNHLPAAALFVSFLAAILLDALYVRRIRHLAFENARPAICHIARESSLFITMGIVLMSATPHTEALQIVQGCGVALLVTLHWAIGRGRKHLG